MRVEVAQVFFELLRGIPVRVDTHQHHLQLVLYRFWQLAFDLAQLGKRGRADVRAVGVAKKQQAPLVLQLIDEHRLTVLVGQGDGR